jgi:3-hydroxyisobutyrate dehydrogenase-like beta-hydroxyacid dehydrogenase
MMGHGVAARLLDTGHEVTIWNRSPGKGDDLVSRGAREASSPAEAVRDSEVAATVLSDDTVVLEIALGEDGVIAALPEGAVYADMSTVSPVTSHSLARATPENRFIDAPIVGSPIATAAGQARWYLGGDEEVIEQLKPLWDDLSSAYFYTGPNGSATALKLLSNLMFITFTTSLSEAMAIAQKSGVSNELLRRIFAESPVLGPGVRFRFDDILEGEHQPLFTVQLAEKDMRLVLELAQKAGVRAAVGEATRQTLLQTEAAGYGNRDLAAVVETMRGKQNG